MITLWDFKKVVHQRTTIDIECNFPVESHEISSMATSEGSRSKNVNVYPSIPYLLAGLSAISGFLTFERGLSHFHDAQERRKKARIPQQLNL